MLQFQQKKSGGKKKKKTSSKSSKNKNEGDGVQQLSGEIGGNSSANSEQDVSVASDTDKDVSSIASEVEEQIAPPAQQVNFAGLKYHVGLLLTTIRLMEVLPYES